MNRRGFLAGAVAVPVLGGCIYRDDLTLQWDEEVLLNDGRKIVANLTHRYERLSGGLTKFGGRLIRRDSTLTFDVGTNGGRISQLFKGYRPTFLGVHEGVWYVLLQGGSYRRTKEEPGQDWGHSWYDYGSVAKLVGGTFEPILIHDLPPLFKYCNLLHLYGEVSEHAQFAGRLVTLDDKQAWSEKHPANKGDWIILRPDANTPRPSSPFKK
jgi:hypothetical protein